eukprot:c9868_g4_i1.p1 GENE.c9868_g4_i1~~c9868_g4_i1.p1  ORF type:complete len:426 (+),score=122.85 c9868_g4_i1:97-1278(+)
MHATNYSHWYLYDEWYPIQYEMWFEPYLITPKGVPLFDEMFSGYGNDKTSQAYELAAAGYAFHVVGNCFLVHLSHNVPLWRTQAQNKVEQAEIWKNWNFFKQRIRRSFNFFISDKSNATETGQVRPDILDKLDVGDSLQFDGLTLDLTENQPNAGSDIGDVSGDANSESGAGNSNGNGKMNSLMNAPAAVLVKHINDFDDDDNDNDESDRKSERTTHGHGHGGVMENRNEMEMGEPPKSSTAVGNKPRKNAMENEMDEPSDGDMDGMNTESNHSKQSIVSRKVVVSKPQSAAPRLAMNTGGGSSSSVMGDDQWIERVKKGTATMDDLMLLRSMQTGVGQLTVEQATDVMNVHVEASASTPPSPSPPPLVERIPALNGYQPRTISLADANIGSD